MLKRSHPTKFWTFFWQIFDKFDGFWFETGQSDFQNKAPDEHLMKNVVCLFDKFQNWKLVGFSANAHERVLAINKFYFYPNFGQV